MKPLQVKSHDVAPESAILDRVQRLALESRQQLKALRRELNEIKVLLKQTSAEVERLAVRATDGTRRVHDLEANMDFFSRQEIRDILTSGQESEMRVFVMKGQLEMLDHKQQTLERMRSLLQSVIEIAASATPNGQTPEDESEEPDRVPALGDSGTPGPIVAQIIQAQEEERQRIARQIHDGPAQALTNLILRAEICQRMLDLNPQEARGDLASLKGTIVNTLQEARRFIFDLRPMILDDLGLVPTLRRQAEIFAARSSIPARLNVTGAERRLPPLVEVTVFRVVQEALDNAAKHGKASEIQIFIDASNEEIKVTVEDNGAGFDVDKVMSSLGQRKGLGFRRMKEQVGTVRGLLNFDSSPGQGCRVTLRIPLGI